MKISMWTAFLVEETPENAIATLAECGYRYAEFSDEHGKILMDQPDPLYAADELAKFAADRSFALEQGHLHLTADIAHPDPARRRAFLDFLKKELEVYERIGVRAAVLHCGGAAVFAGKMTLEEAETLTVESLSTLCRSIAGSRIRIAIENVPVLTPFASDLLRVIAKVGRPQELGICLDTGHLNLVQGDPAAFIDEAGDKLLALHVADNLGNADHHMLPCGRGSVNWTAFMRALKRSPYRGLFNFEVPGERNCLTSAIRKLKLKYALELGRLMFDIV
ncbi:sugar phosphate isomerase/epimerase [uncultured Victivallis sp.]|uniref:sugar phosphate isomerase/epimerase family protein n=1 Tax=uncultured Victivallis sp. TaxID=354118 RepID=UPI0025FA4BAB|nr:sugar phosphate isomerase/epimerase [uncultured Victivallis sp.]